MHLWMTSNKAQQNEPQVKVELFQVITGEQNAHLQEIQQKSILFVL